MTLAFCFLVLQPFMGDNYCDSVNNRAFCNYDGGDCCQSTVKTKKVQSPLSVCLSVCPSVRLSVCQSVCPSPFLSVQCQDQEGPTSSHLSVCLSVRLFVIAVRFVLYSVFLYDVQTIMLMMEESDQLIDILAVFCKSLLTLQPVVNISMNLFPSIQFTYHSL